MLSKTLRVLDLAEPITDIHHHSCDSIDSVKRPAVLLLASPITVGHLAGWDMILCKQGLTGLNALFPAGPKPVTIQVEGITSFALKEWSKAGLAMWQVTSAALTIEDEVSHYLLPVFEFMVLAMSVKESQECNLFVRFTQLFPATISN